MNDIFTTPKQFDDWLTVQSNYVEISETMNFDLSPTIKDLIYIREAAKNAWIKDVLEAYFDSKTLSDNVIHLECLSNGPMDETYSIVVTGCNGARKVIAQKRFSINLC